MLCQTYGDDFEAILISESLLHFLLIDGFLSNATERRAAWRTQDPSSFFVGIGNSHAALILHEMLELMEEIEET